MWLGQNSFLDNHYIWQCRSSSASSCNTQWTRHICWMLYFEDWLFKGINWYLPLSFFLVIHKFHQIISPMLYLNILNLNNILMSLQYNQMQGVGWLILISIHKANCTWFTYWVVSLHCKSYQLHFVKTSDSACYIWRHVIIAKPVSTFCKDVKVQLLWKLSWTNILEMVYFVFRKQKS